MFSDQNKFQIAISDFQSARMKAGIQEVLARITGKSTQLFSYEEVAEKLKLRVRTERGVQNIPLNAIVGSVGRYTDFTRTFLPRSDNDQERWTHVKTAFMESGASLPPIEVYKVGEAYFVVDGNHRVSIARQEGLVSIEGRVIEIKTDTPLTPNVQPDDLIIKAEYVEFLDATNIHQAYPNADLSVTSCCQFEKLMDQIRVCQYTLQEETSRMFRCKTPLKTGTTRCTFPSPKPSVTAACCAGFPTAPSQTCISGSRRTAPHLKKNLGGRSDLTSPQQT